jgi:hypothetical protein
MDMSSYASAGVFIKPDHLHGPERVTITGVEQGQFKPVAVLKDGRKLGLNGTTVGVLIRAFGSESGNWIGKTIEIAPGTTTFNGATKPTVIVRVVTQSQQRPSAPSAEGGPRDNMDDVIPF